MQHNLHKKSLDPFDRSSTNTVITSGFLLGKKYVLWSTASKRQPKVLQVANK